MKANLKPATPKARALLKKLQALADHGIDGEKISAQNKIARLKARFDFSAAARAETHLFFGTFRHSATARRIYSFGSNEFDLANSVKWAIHPYTMAVSLGKQIRFSAPLEQITAELEAVTQKHLTHGA